MPIDTSVYSQQRQGTPFLENVARVNAFLNQRQQQIDQQEIGKVRKNVLSQFFGGGKSDPVGARNALLSFGDIEGAKQIELAAGGSGGDETFFQPQFMGQDEQGKPIWAQASNRGTGFRMLEAPGGKFVAPIKIDLEDKTILVDPVTREVIREDISGMTPYQRAQISPEVQADVEEAKSRAREVGQAAGQKQAELGQKVEKYQEAITELESLVGAFDKIPQSVPGQKWEQAKAYFGKGTKDVQKALGEIDRISGRMLEYVNRLPGAATDKDREVFMASAGILNSPDASVERKKAAALSAIQSYRRLVQKYGSKPAENNAPAVARPPLNDPDL